MYELALDTSTSSPNTDFKSPWSSVDYLNITRITMQLPVENDIMIIKNVVERMICDDSSEFQSSAFVELRNVVRDRYY
jgi:hypothetical protein